MEAFSTRRARFVKSPTFRRPCANVFMSRANYWGVDDLAHGARFLSKLISPYARCRLQISNAFYPANFVKARLSRRRFAAARGRSALRIALRKTIFFLCSYARVGIIAKAIATCRELLRLAGWAGFRARAARKNSFFPLRARGDYFKSVVGVRTVKRFPRVHGDCRETFPGSWLHARVQALKKPD